MVLMMIIKMRSTRALFSYWMLQQRPTELSYRPSPTSAASVSWFCHTHPAALQCNIMQCNYDDDYICGDEDDNEDALVSWFCHALTALQCNIMQCNYDDDHGCGNDDDNEDALFSWFCHALTALQL